MRQRLAEAFEADPTFARASLYPAERRAELRFHFPDVARSRYAGALDRLAAETGWRLEIRSTPDQAALQAAARRHLPAGLSALAAPSLHQEDRAVAVKVGSAPADALAGAARAFREETGYGLVVRDAPCLLRAGSHMSPLRVGGEVRPLAPG